MYPTSTIFIDLPTVSDVTSIIYYGVACGIFMYPFWRLFAMRRKRAQMMKK